MLLKTELNLVKCFSPILFIAAMYSSSSHAYVIDCSAQASSQSLCHERLSKQREQFNDLSLTTLLITDAPIKLVKDSQQLWLERTQQCKNFTCFNQQFEQRIDQLNIFTSLNQSLTQHYLKFENGQIAKQPVHLQIHQLSKNNIKIEGVAYRNPNNRLDKQSIPFLAYSSPEEKQQIHDNENTCNYDFKYQKAILIVSTEQKGCERFSGIYRLYD
jgi:uncharacterized protein